MASDKALACLLWRNEFQQGDRGFPGGPVVKNPPSNEGDLSSIPGQETKIPHAMEQPSPSAATREPKCCNEDPAQPKFLNKKDRESSKISTVFVRRKKVCVNRHTQVGQRRRRQWHPTPVLLPGESHGCRSLVGCSPWGRKESDTTEAT